MICAIDRISTAEAQHMDRRLDHIIEYSHVRKQIEMLKHHSDFAAYPPQQLIITPDNFTVHSMPSEGLAVDVDDSRVRPLDCHQKPKERCLS